MRLETASSASTLTTTLVTPQRKKEAEWGRPRRQTDPAVARRPSSELPREPARHSVCYSPPPSEPQTRDWTNTNSPVSRSPLSVQGLSNPAFAEISSRKFNALRNSTGSLVDGPPSSVPLSPTTAVSVAAAPSAQTSPDPRDLAYTCAGLSPSTTTDIISASPTAATTSSPSSTQVQLQPTLFGLDSRSSHQKRAPASRSSHGIETSTGPPPALSTRRSHLQDKGRRPVVSLDLSNISRPLSQPASPTRKSNLSWSIDAILKGDLSGTTASERREQSPSSPRTSASTASKGQMSSTATYLGHSILGSDKGQTDRRADMQGADDSSKDSSADENRSKNEDIFLNIAKSSVSRRDSAGRRSSKFGISALSSRASRANEQTPSPEQSRYNDQKTPSQSQDNSPSLPYSFGGYSSSASAHPLDEPSRMRYFVGSSARTTIGLPRSRLNRVGREVSPEPQNHPEKRASVNDTRPYRQSNLSAARTIRQASNSDAAERTRLEADRLQQESTESTLSTTAPSTVWDELDDLKSRIRKLELTGKLPPSSAAAMSNASVERPRTATTTVTTLSSSPKHGRKASAPSPDTEAAATTVNPTHPLLHSALAKAKSVISSEVYRALEATANDALTLATMLGSNAPPSGSVSVINGFSPSERQAKRKADSMCRSLTELCLALSDERLISLSKQRPGSRDATPGPNQANANESDSQVRTISYRRSASHEPEELSRPQTSSRVPSRLEARRASMMNISSSGGSRPQDTKSAQTPTPASRLSRLSTSIHTQRQRAEDGSDDKTIAVNRPISRTVTEVGNPAPVSRFSPRDRLSREYPSSRPLPDSRQGQNLSSPQQEQQQTQPRTPTFSQSALPLRRSILSPTTSYIPATSSVKIQPGFRRYGASTVGQNTAENTVTESPVNMTESSQQPQTRIAAPSSKMAASYTAIQQPRIRTNSLSTRRLGLRQRPMNTTGDGVNTASYGVN